MFNEYKYNREGSQVIVNLKMRTRHSVRRMTKRKPEPHIPFLLQGKSLKIWNPWLNMFRWARRQWRDMKRLMQHNPMLFGKLAR
jgi:hypothetical protein